MSRRASPQRRHRLHGDCLHGFFILHGCVLLRCFSSKLFRCNSAVLDGVGIICHDSTVCTASECCESAQHLHAESLAWNVASTSSALLYRTSTNRIHRPSPGAQPYPAAFHFSFLFIVRYLLECAWREWWRVSRQASPQRWCGLQGDCLYGLHRLHGCVLLA